MGTNGLNGSDGTSGTSGADGSFFGTSGTSGVNGSSGSSGLTAGAGTSGSSGTSGISGTNGSITLSGTTDNGLVTYDGVIGNAGNVESSMTYNGTTRELVVSGSIDVYSATRLRPLQFNGLSAPGYISSLGGTLAVSSSTFGEALVFHNGSQWVKVAGT
jgi:hypothetical protein